MTKDSPGELTPEGRVKPFPLSFFFTASFPQRVQVCGRRQKAQGVLLMLTKPAYQWECVGCETVGQVLSTVRNAMYEPHRFLWH